MAVAYSVKFTRVQEGWTSLMIACEKGYFLTALQLLLVGLCDVDIKNQVFEDS